MNDSELSDLLRKVEAPSRNDEYWNEFPRTVTREIARGARSQAAPRRVRVWFATSLASGLASLLVLAGFWLGNQHRRNQERVEGTVEARKLIAELAAMFPNQLQAVVIQNGRTELRLSEKADVPSSTPILLRICGKTGCSQVITFSGQQVRVNDQWCDVLVDARGDVIVAGPSLVWSTDRVNSSGIRIEARSLGDVL